MKRNETSRSSLKHRGRLLKRMWQYMGRNRLMIVLAVLLSAASSLLSLYGPKLSGQAINAITDPNGIDFKVVLTCAAWMAGCYILSAGFSYLLQYVMIRLSRRVAKQMRHDIFENLTRLPVAYFDNRQVGDIVSVITYDVDTVNQSLAADALQILQSTITVVVSLVMMLSIAPVLVPVFAVTIPITILFTRWLANRVRPMFRFRSKKLGELNGFVEEMLGGQKTVRAYGREDAVQERFEEKNVEAVNAYTRAEANGTVTGPSVNFINNVSLALVCVIGSWLFLKGRIRLGDLSSFVQYSRKFSGPINEVANIIAELQSAFAAAERVFALIDAEPEAADAADAKELADVRGEVEIDRVNFSYDKVRPIITNFSLEAPPGSLIAIVGPTGAGKTTIINLLMRFYDVDKGEIRVDQQPIRSLTRASLRKAYAMVLQDTWLFSGTIFDNIAYGKKDATEAEVVAAAKAAHIHSYISRLNDGYQTVLYDNGAGISKGQKQLLTIARAMLLDANMLILDEATSNVDTRTEQQIQAAMRELMKNKTCFVIAHRLSTIRNADNILVMRGGQVVEQGTHDQLMQRPSFYRELYRAQFESA
ncbi:MAG: ABC transporter ATP-binding protein, partial [Clostridia bacterium]|nr:ABC transporter ATP-binding protein [Clostridia bacterium]